ncbi:MAG: hypothetical protein ACRYFX_21100 [Janthinobacterium lividum]
MKNILVLTALLALATAGVHAQTPAQVKMQVGAQAQRLSGQLSLTPEQFPKVRQILYDGRLEMDAARAKATASGDKSGLRTAMQTARAKTTTQLQKVLTATQFVQYQQIAVERISQLHSTSQTN